MTKSLISGLRPTHPGEVLREIVLPAVKPGKAEIARLLGISRQHLYDILGEKKPITSKVALRMEALFGGEAATWCRMQTAYDLSVERREMAADLDQIRLLEAA